MKLAAIFSSIFLVGCLSYNNNQTARSMGKGKSETLYYSNSIFLPGSLNPQVNEEDKTDETTLARSSGIGFRYGLGDSTDGEFSIDGTLSYGLGLKFGLVATDRFAMAIGTKVSAGLYETSLGTKTKGRHVLFSNPILMSWSLTDMQTLTMAIQWHGQQIKRDQTETANSILAGGTFGYRFGSTWWLGLEIIALTDIEDKSKNIRGFSFSLGKATL